MYTLDKLKINDTAYIAKIEIANNFKRRLLDLGFVTGSPITALYKSPAGNPTAYLIKGTIIAIRIEDATHIILNKNKTPI